MNKEDLRLFNELKVQFRKDLEDEMYDMLNQGWARPETITFYLLVGKDASYELVESRKKLMVRAARAIVSNGQLELIDFEWSLGQLYGTFKIKI